MALVSVMTDNLCSVCSHIDFDNIALQAKPCNGDCDNSGSVSEDGFDDSGSALEEGLSDSDSNSTGWCTESGSDSSELSEFDTKLGTNHEISLRTNQCILCRLIDRHIRRLYPSSSGHVTLRARKNLVISSLPADTKLQHTHTTTATIEYRHNNEDGPQTHIPGTWQVSRVLDLQSLRHASPASDTRQQTPQSLVGGRIIPDKVDFELLRKWLKLCKDNHDDVQKACIVKTPPDCSYVALSYVWGTSKVLMHMSNNANLLLTTGSLNTEDIPKTVRDAISATAGLNEQFLWVDALCIIQDDPTMKISQIEKMDQIYAGAILTLVAGHGDSAAVGLPGVNSRPSDFLQEVLHLKGHTFLTVVGAYRSQEANNGEIDGPSIQSSTWIHRAWTMQELCFSNRLLVFTENQAFWRCNSNTWSEELALEEAHSNDLEIMPFELEKGLPKNSIKASDYFSLYCHYLQAYRRRKLSFKSDLINAFQGIISVFSRTQKDEYLWGHPKAFFSASLGWMYESKHIRNFASQEMTMSGKDIKNIEFPSWSWAAWDNREESGRELDFWSYRSLGRGFSEPSTPHPTITQFYAVTGEGNVTAIQENLSKDRMTKTTAKVKRLRWQGPERDIPDQHVQNLAQNSNLVPGTLIFWASVATLRVRPTEGSPSESNVSDDTDSDKEQKEVTYEVPGKFKITGTGEWPFGNQAHFEAWLGGERDESSYKIVLPGDPQLPGTFSVEFAVVYRHKGAVFDAGIDGKRKAKLMLLALEWKEGLAYRIGLGEISEEEWAKMGDREWKLITMR
ncbi:hypothetical protein ACHAPD_004689 [Fusarium lateritium]